MARTAPTATYDPPDPDRAHPSLPIRASDWRALGQATNGMYAWGGVGTPPIQQAWLDGAFSYGGALALRPRWRIPELSPRHTAVGLYCRVYTEAFVGVAAQVRFTAVNGAASVDATPLAARGWYEAAAPLACDFTPGYEDVEVRVGTGAGTLTIDTVQCSWAPLTSPLASGATGNFTPIDDAETAADFPLSADLGRTIREGLVDLETRQRVYLNFSGLPGIVTTGHGLAMDYMRLYSHRAWVPVHYGTRDVPLTLTVWVRATGAGVVVIQHGPGGAGMDAGGGNQTTIVTAAGTAWYTETIQLPEVAEVRELPHPYVRVEVWPREPAALPGFGGSTTAQINSLAIWGR